MTAQWPCHILKPRARVVNPGFRSVSGGQAVNGFSQVVASDAGAWRATYDGVLVRTHQQIIAWRGLAAQLQGRLNPVLICVCDNGRYPLPPGVSLSDRTLHDDGTPFAEDLTGYAEPVFIASVRNNAAARSSSIVIDKSQMTLAPGHRFSVVDRLYEIRDVEWQTAVAAKVKVWPPVRDAIPAGTFCEFAEPVVRMRLATDSEMDLGLEQGRRASATVNFVEDMA